VFWRVRRTEFGAEAWRPPIVDWVNVPPRRRALHLKLSRRQPPNVQALLEQDDVEALAEAARFQDLRRDRQGRTVDHGSDIRRDAVLALGRLGPDAGNGAVVAALEDRIDLVRSAAVRVLYERGDATEIARALHWLPAGRGSSRKLAVEAVLKLRSTEAARIAVAALVRASGEEPLPDADIDVIHALAEPIGTERPVDGVVSELVAALGDERDAVADRAEELLVQLAPASTPVVIGELDSGASAGRVVAVLTRIGDTAAVEGLIEALERGNVDLRAQAAAALGWLRHLDGVEPLIQATRDPHPDVRAEASQALDEMGTAAVIVGVSSLLRPALEEAVRSAAWPGRPDGTRQGALQLRVPDGPLRFADALDRARDGSRPAA
jgi:HEAT repeat protein